MVLHLILDEGSLEFILDQVGNGLLSLRVQDVEFLNGKPLNAGGVARQPQREPWGNLAFNLLNPAGNYLHLESRG